MELSIIIPTYNNENTIENCINSIELSNKSLDLNFEIIIINDGSLDSTLNVCHQLTNKYNNIKLINIANAGVSNARNKGISTSSGKYITFVDADDYVEESYLKDIFEYISSEKYDFILFDYFKMTNNNKRYAKEKNDFTLQDNKKLFFKEVIYGNLGCPWNKVFRSSIIKNNNLMFNTNMVVQEDMEFVLRFLKLSKTSIHVDRANYNYVINTNGAMSKCNDKYLKNYYDIYNFMIQSSLELDLYTEVIDTINEIYIKKLIGSYITLKKYNGKNKAYKMVIESRLYSIIKNKKYSFKTMIKLILFKTRLI